MVNGELVVLCEVGSQAYGTSNENSDTDYVHVVIPEERHILGLGTWESSASTGEEDYKMYSLKKYVALLLKGNPGLLETLWTPHRCIRSASPAYHALRNERDIFTSRHVYNAFVGYANSQLWKITGQMGRARKNYVLEIGYDPKNASHLVRLLKMGIEFAETGELFVDRTGKDADLLKEIKAGQWALQDVKDLADDLFADAAAAIKTSTLPKNPQHGRAEDLLIAAHRESLWPSC